MQQVLLKQERGAKSAISEWLDDSAGISPMGDKRS
jgi:hypothetical protein